MKMVAVLVSAGLAASASAQVVFDNFGAGDSYTTGSGWTLSGINSVIGADNDQGDAFTPGQGGAVATFEVAIGLVTGSNEFDLTLYDDAGGAPGSPIWNSGPIVGQMGSFGQNNPPIVVSGAGANVNAGDTYWLIASTADDTWAAWNQNSIGDVGGHAFQQNGGGFNVSQNTRGAFRVTLVPSPAGLALLGMGGLVAARRRR